MVAIPKQTMTVRDPGLSTTPEAIETYLYAGTCSAGVVGRIYSFNDPASVVDTLGQGPLPEDLCRALIEAGGPQLGQRLTGDVLVGSPTVTKLPKSTSTGSVTVGSTPAEAARCWQIDDPAGTPVYVDMTTQFNNATTADVIFWPAAEAVGDQFAIGFASPIRNINLTLSTNGVGGTVLYKYWNGTAWTAFSFFTDTTTGLTTSGAVIFTIPTDWVPRSINGSDELYYMVIEVATVYATNPVGTSGFIDKHGPFDSYDAIVPIVTTGTLGVGEFQYSFDDGNSYSPTLTIPSGGTYDIPNTGTRLTFTPGAGPKFFEAGDKFLFNAKAPYVSTTSLAAGFTAIQNATDEFAAYVLCGRAADATTAAAMFSALAVQAEALFAQHRFIGCIMNAGTDTAANNKTQFAAVSSSRLMVTFDTEHVASSKPFTGWSQPKRSTAHVIASRAAASLISTHLGRFADGPLDGVKDIAYNEEKGTDAMSAARFATLRTWQGFPGGFYINRPNMMSAPGSDFTLWPHRRIMDTACDTAHKTLQQFANSKIRVRTDGTGFIDEKEALRIEGVVNAGLGDNILVPVDAEGNPGHAADIRYIVDRAYNVQQNNKVKGRVAIVRDGYAEEIITELGFAAQAV